MENKHQAKQTLHSLFNLPENRHNFELFYKVLSQSMQGLCLCQVMPEERLRIFGFFNSDPLIERIHVIDMVKPLCGPMELQMTIIDVQEKYGEKKNIFFIYNFESCIYLSKTSAKDFFQKMNLIRDFFMGFNATFVFFVTESSLKKMIQNAFDFYDWIKFTFTFVPESRYSIIQPLELRKDEEAKYTNIRQKIQYLENSIKKATNEREKAIKLNDLATLYHQAGDYDAALERLLEAFEIDEKNNDLVSMATRYNNIGQIYQAKGELDKALESSFKALKIDEKNNNIVNMAIRYNNIGQIYQAKGELDKALEFSFMALKIDEKNKNLVNMAIWYNNIGAIYQAKGELDKALEFSFKALEILKKNNEQVKMAVTYSNIGQIYQAKGELDKALEFSFNALEILKKNNEQVKMAVTYSNIGQIYQAKGDLDKALEFIFKALEIFKNNNDRVKMALSYGYIGNIYKAKGENKNAEKHFKRTEEIEKEIRGKR